MEALGKPDRQVRFGHVRVLAYQRGKLTKKQERVVDVVLRRDYPPEVETVWEGEYPFYLTDKDWNVRPGDIYLDFETAKDGGRFKFYGIYQVRENWRLVVEGQKLVLCNPLLDLAGIRLGKAERRALCKTVREWVVGNDWKTDEQDNYLDMPLTEFLPVGWPNA
jgi:hypothetical protein